jgi:hypothetical protein
MSSPDGDSCPQMANCPMYGIFTYAGTLATWKLRYCTADYRSCARYMAAERNQPVPVNLMPNGALLKKGAPR